MKNKNPYEEFLNGDVSIRHSSIDRRKIWKLLKDITGCYPERVYKFYGIKNGKIIGLNPSIASTQQPAMYISEILIARDLHMTRTNFSYFIKKYCKVKTNLDLEIVKQANNLTRK
jgi:hypothetical protein